jgi:hypothetical protein
MGLLVEVAQNLEDRVSAIRQQSEPKLKLRLREAKADWLELKSRSKGSTWAELHTSGCREGRCPAKTYR